MMVLDATYGKFARLEASPLTRDFQLTYFRDRTIRVQHSKSIQLNISMPL